MKPEIVTLETSSLVLGFDRSSGSLVKLYSKASNWNVIKRPKLGLSWRMMLPLEGKRNNEAWGHKQPDAPRCECTDERIVFTWDSITTEFGGKMDVKVTAECAVENDQAVFRMHLSNRSGCLIENVYYPYIGDLYRTNNCESMKFEHGSYIAMKTYSMYPIFPNCQGTHSVDYPTLCVEDHINPPMNPFGLISDNNGNGLYLGVAERRMEAATWHAEYLPGWREQTVEPPACPDARLGEGAPFLAADPHQFSGGRAAHPV